MAATTRLILTDSETKIDARLCLARMQIFDASTADGFVEGRLGFGPQPEAAEWPPRGPPLEGRVAETPGNAL